MRPETGFTQSGQRGSLTIALSFMALFLVFTFLMLAFGSGSEARLAMKNDEKRLKARYAAESGFGAAVVRLAETVDRAGGRIPSGRCDALEGMNPADYGFMAPYGFKCTDLEILATGATGSSGGGYGIIARVKMEGWFEDVSHSIERSIKF